MPRPELTIKQILEWADAHHERTGQWPNVKDGLVWEAVDEKWINIDQALRLGLRGLHRGQTLARLLAKHRGKRNRRRLPKFTLRQILAWVDAHHRRTGDWPRCTDGRIPGAPGETWLAVDMALRNGLRGLPGNSSLPKLLASQRGVRNPAARPRLSVQQILAWAGDYHLRTGNWPTEKSGPIRQSQGDTWCAVVQALHNGGRGLRRTSLATLLARYRGVTRHVRKPPLSVDQVLTWADEYHARTGSWPTNKSGEIRGTEGETWRRINVALSQGKRGLIGGETLATLFSKHRGRRSRVFLPVLTESLILRWARAYKRRHGRWPKRNSGLIPGTGGETWSGVNANLRERGRGLKRRLSLAQLIEAQR